MESRLQNEIKHDFEPGLSADANSIPVCVIGNLDRGEFQAVDDTLTTDPRLHRRQRRNIPASATFDGGFELAICRRAYIVAQARYSAPDLPGRRTSWLGSRVA